MHLGFLTPEYPHPSATKAAGIGTSIKNISRMLVSQGIQVSIFLYGQGKSEIFTENGIKFHLIKKQIFSVGGWYLHRKFLQNYLNKFIERDHIDAIEAPDWTGITAFMNLKCPLVIRMNGSDTYFCHLENRPQKIKNFWFEKLAIQGADHLLSVSQFTADTSKKIFNINKEIKIIPNSVDTESFAPQPHLATKDRVLYFGTLVRKKGVLELPGVFNIISNRMNSVRFIFVGNDTPDIETGISTKALIDQQFSSTTRKHTSWLGNLPYSEIKEEIAKAAVVVLPSFAEALPMTWIEAMAMEKALVTSDIGWAKEVMEQEESGFMVNPKDHTEFAEKIMLLLKHSSLANKMGVNARERVQKKFAASVVVAQNIEYYRSIVSKAVKRY